MKKKKIISTSYNSKKKFSKIKYIASKFLLKYIKTKKIKRNIKNLQILKKKIYEL
jgi:hypothetical protein